MTVFDLMSGTGSNFKVMANSVKNNTIVVALDNSPEMNAIARIKQQFCNEVMVLFREEDFFNNRLSDHSIDAAVCTFGLKTVFPGYYEKLASEMFRVLKSDGQVSFIEASAPRSFFMSKLFFCFINYIVPLLNKLLNTNYYSEQLLSNYIKQFGDCRRIADIFNQNGFQVKYYSLDAGMATGFYGKKYNSTVD